MQATKNEPASKPSRDLSALPYSDPIPFNMGAVCAFHMAAFAQDQSLHLAHVIFRAFVLEQDRALESWKTVLNGLATRFAAPIKAMYIYRTGACGASRSRSPAVVTFQIRRPAPIQP